MKITLHKSNSGAIIGIIVGVILLLLAIFLIIYLLLALFSVPVRALPKEPGEAYFPYLFEAMTNEKYSQLEAPEGMQWRSVPLLTSTNMTDWELVYCQVDVNGGIHAPDGSVLKLDGKWDEESKLWSEFEPVLVVPGRSEMRVFRLAR